MKNFYILPLEALSEEAKSDFYIWVKFVNVHILNGVITHISGHSTVEEACRFIQSSCEEWEFLNDTGGQTNVKD